MAGIQSGGTNIDINTIVTKLMQVESKPLTRLATKEASYQTKISAYNTLNSAVTSFQGSLTSLNSLSTFQTLNTTSSDSTIATATAKTGSTPGSYSIAVSKLAQAQSITTAGQASTSAAIGSGTSSTISIQFGSISGGTLTSGTYTGATFTQDANQALATVTIDSTNNTLTGIRDAINSANQGVSASIVGDGSANPYHLVLSSTKTGATSSLKISVTGDAALQSLLNYDPAGTQNLTETTTAQNAALTVNGIAVSSASNSVTDAIQGTTLNLSKVGTTSISLTNNVSAVSTSVSNFVKAFNELNSTVKTLTGYDAAAKKGGTLQGDISAVGIQNQLRGILNQTITGLGGSFTSLSTIGITTQKDGTLILDNAKLQAALSSNFSDVAGLFSTVGKATDSNIAFAGSSSVTKAGSYAVNVSALATKGSFTGDLDLTSATTTIASDTKFNVTVDGKTASVSIAAGSYSGTQLTTLLQTSINGTSAFSSSGIKVSASLSGGFLKIQSDSYGSTSNVKIENNTGTTVSNLFGTTTAGVDGTNVTGTINGVAATGSGQFLTAASGGDAEGISLLVNGGAIGDRGTVTFSRGYASQLQAYTNLEVSSNGSIASSKNAINKSLVDLTKQRDTMNGRLVETEARYRAQFIALDALVGTLNSTSTFLTQQLNKTSSN